jgi:hypothetical protein
MTGLINAYDQSMQLYKMATMDQLVVINMDM